MRKYSLNAVVACHARGCICDATGGFAGLTRGVTYGMFYKVVTT
jgi:hypothetical protein